MWATKTQATKLTASTLARIPCILHRQWRRTAAMIHLSTAGSRQSGKTRCRSRNGPFRRCAQPSCKWSRSRCGTLHSTRGGTHLPFPSRTAAVEQTDTDTTTEQTQMRTLTLLECRREWGGGRCGSWYLAACPCQQLSSSSGGGCAFHSLLLLRAASASCRDSRTRLPRQSNENRESPFEDIKVARRRKRKRAFERAKAKERERPKP
mmetsp:Transcript_5125/g.15107  ORF Transcript_5125/g.15107 Transcript_5125/m.15107 type:complete len:207 (+) Transcript_5125:989-1609(+)